MFCSLALFQTPIHYYRQLFSLGTLYNFIGLAVDYESTYPILTYIIIFIIFNICLLAVHYTLDLHYM